MTGDEAQGEPGKGGPAGNEHAEGEAAGREPAGNEHAEGEAAGREPAGNEQPEGEAAGREPAGNEQAEGEAAGREPAGNQPAWREPAGSECAWDDLARTDPGPGRPAPDDAGSAYPTPGDGGGPVGDVYEWYVRGVELLRQGSPAAAMQLLSRAADAEPWSRSVREALARAQYAAGLYPQAQENFAAIVEVDPADDYAQFGLGVAARRNGDLRTAVEHLALAVALRPGVGHYDRALRGARAALGRQ